MALQIQQLEKDQMISSLFDTGILQSVQNIAVQINNAGFKCCIVGGAVRDILSGRAPLDVDLVTTAPPEIMKQLFPELKFAGASFGVMLLRNGNFEFEIAAAREERCYMDGRHPESIRYTADLDVDAMRRDFTINAMRIDPVTGELSDPAGGLADLRTGILRTVGDPEQRFKEDHLRMLRAVRFASKLNFSIEENTFSAICRLSGLASGLSGERIREEMSRILTGKNPARAMKLMLETGLLRAVLPEAADMAGVTQPPEFHPEGDVFQHTCLMLEHMAMPDELLAWSVLFHDIGKPVTRSVEPNGRIRFFGHEERGEKMAVEIMERLRFSNSAVQAVSRAVRNHMRMASVKNMRTAKLKKLMADENFKLELELHRLDCISCHCLMDTFVFFCDRLCEEPETALPEPWVRGRDLVAAGFVPCPEFKRIIEAAFDRQLANDFSDRQEALKYAVEQMNSSGAIRKFVPEQIYKNAGTDDPATV